jgi:hypothetical protein
MADRRRRRQVAGRQQIRDALQRLPARRVGVGAEWTVPQDVVVEVPNGPRKAVRTRLRYRLEALKDGIATIAVDTTVLTPIDDPRLEARLLERIWDGTSEIQRHIISRELLRPLGA